MTRRTLKTNHIFVSDTGRSKPFVRPVLLKLLPPTNFFGCNPNCYHLWTLLKTYYRVKISSEIPQNRLRTSGRSVLLLLISNADSRRSVSRKTRNYFTIRSAYLNDLGSTLPLPSSLVCVSGHMVVICPHLLLIQRSLFGRRIVRLLYRARLNMN